jgi:P27 family predicted phage terminase small subunit
MRGRKPQPTALKILKGTRADRINRNEPKKLDEKPQKSELLDAHGQAEWDRIVPKLEAMGVLSSIDESSLNQYCMTYSRWRKAQIMIGRSGMVLKSQRGGLRVSPFVQIAIKAEEAMARFHADFGCTPSSRSRLSVNPLTQDDPLTKFLASRK